MVSGKPFNIKCFQKFMIFRNTNMHFDPEHCKLKIGNEILEI